MTENKRTEKELIFQSQIEALSFAAVTAIKTSDADAFTSAVRQLNTLSMDIDISGPLRDLASRIHDQLSISMTDESLKTMSQLVANLSNSMDALKSAIEVAKRTKQDLLFPGVADTAASVLKTFTDLKSAVDKVQGDISAATTKELGDIPAKLAVFLQESENLGKAINPMPLDK